MVFGSFILFFFCFYFTGKEFITGVDLFLSEDYLNGTYDSCSKVSVPSTGQLALDIMCGQWGASRCSAIKYVSHNYSFKKNNN